MTMDSMFKNLATGITYKGEEDITIDLIISDTCLRYANMKLINWHEINKFEGKITNTGQIEKTFDAKEGWFTVEELIEYIRNMFTNNNKETNEIVLNMEEKNGLQIGDRIEIDLEECLTKGNFIITSIQGTVEGNNILDYSVELRNTNLLENFIDLFRNSTDIEEKSSQTETEYVVEYAEEETIIETHNIYTDTEVN